MRNSNKKIAAVVLGAVALTGTGVAYAYWTTTGTGTGQATAGTAADGDVIQLTQVGTTEGMYPGGPAKDILVRAVNPATFDQRVGDLTITPTYPTNCGTANWTLVNEPGDFGQILKRAGSVDSSSAPTDRAEEVVGSVALNETGANQDACKGAVPTFVFTTAPSA